tara:strand:+ start:156 stop:434 length:279 start_codon:yes stop_codon:yes gene_type:complete
MKRKKYERNRKLIQGNVNQIPKLKTLRRKSMSIDITKSKFDEYKTVQKSGMFNMFDPKAREMTSLTKDEWVTIMQDYEKLDNAWSDNEENEE